MSVYIPPVRDSIGWRSAVDVELEKILSKLSNSYTSNSLITFENIKDAYNKKIGEYVKRYNNKMCAKPITLTIPKKIYERMNREAFYYLKKAKWVKDYVNPSDQPSNTSPIGNFESDSSLEGLLEEN